MLQRRKSSRYAQCKCFCNNCEKMFEQTFQQLVLVIRTFRHCHAFLFNNFARKYILFDFHAFLFLASSTSAACNNALPSISVPHRLAPLKPRSLTGGPTGRPPSPVVTEQRHQHVVTIEQDPFEIKKNTDSNTLLIDTTSMPYSSPFSLQQGTTLAPLAETPNLLPVFSGLGNPTPTVQSVPLIDLSQSLPVSALSSSAHADLSHTVTLDLTTTEADFFSKSDGAVKMNFSG